MNKISIMSNQGSNLQGKTKKSIKQNMVRRLKLSRIDKSMKSEPREDIIKPNCKLTQSWVWDKTVNEFVQSKIIGSSINICSGLSPTGDIKVDLEPKKPEVKKEDMNNLPYPDNSFDTVISDPPWKIGFFQRMKPFFEAVRVCKVGGRINYNCTWRPTSKCVELEEAIIRTDNTWSNVSVIYIFKKIKDLEK